MVTEISGPWQFESGGKTAVLDVGTRLHEPGTLWAPANTRNQYVNILLRSGRHQPFRCGSREECLRPQVISAPPVGPGWFENFLEWFIERFQHDPEHLKSMIGGLPPAFTSTQVARLHRDSIDLTHVFEGLRPGTTRVGLFVNEPNARGTTALGGYRRNPGVDSALVTQMHRQLANAWRVSSENSALLAASTIEWRPGVKTMLPVPKLRPGIYGLIVSHPEREFVWLSVQRPRDFETMSTQFQQAQSLVNSWETGRNGEFAAIFLRAYLVYLTTR